MEAKEFYFRHLPHFQPIGGTFFVTYNLAGSIPAEVISKLQDEYELEKNKLANNNSGYSEMIKIRKTHFLKYENLLSSNINGPHYLKNNLIAIEVANSLHFWDKKSLELICFCIMSNHVHLVIRLFDKDEIDSPKYLNKVMKSIKQFSATKANKILQREGEFWQRESYDYQVRNRNELFRIISYVLDNPVKAGLCVSRDQWKWSYIKSIYNEFI